MGSGVIQRAAVAFSTCDWARVRELLRGAAGGESVEGLEMLATAAWWLDDLATLCDADERRYRAGSRRR